MLASGVKPYQYVYPFPPEALARLVPWFEFDYADGRDPDQYAAGFKRAVEAWCSEHERAWLQLRIKDEWLEITDTRPSAARPETVLSGAARLTYLALEAGRTLRGLQAELERALGGEAPSVEQIEGWLGEWLEARLVMREGPRHLSLAVNPAERVRLPIERYLEIVAGASR